MSKKEMFELTNPQKSIWMMEQFYNGTNINNICATVTINKDVDIEKLNKAINKMVQKNESFGLNFRIENGEIDIETIIDFVDSNNKYIDIYNKNNILQ